MRNIWSEFESKPKLRLPIFGCSKFLVVQRTIGCLPPVTVACMFYCYLRGSIDSRVSSFNILWCLGFNSCIETTHRIHESRFVWTSKVPGRIRREFHLEAYRGLIFSPPRQSWMHICQAEETRNNKSCGSGQAMKLCQIHRSKSLMRKHVVKKYHAKNIETCRYTYTDLFYFVCIINNTISHILLY